MDSAAVEISDSQIDALETATRDLVGVALRSLQLLHGEVSLPQFRMLIALTDLGPCPSSQVAAALGLGASSITRLADRLEAAGHVSRGRDLRNRSVVTLQLTPSGEQLVNHVVEGRRVELARILAALEPAERVALATGLGHLHTVADEAFPADLQSPLPL
jgi:DNA-binding MarR family transcriptional regulator